jgi:uncharacterized protein DUF2846
MQSILVALAIVQSTAANGPGSQPIALRPASVPVIAIAVPQLGKIVMYRGSSITGAGLACPSRYKGEEIVELARGKYTEWSVPAGRYILTNHTSSIEVAVDPGETRYVRCMIKAGMLTGRADLQIVDEESFNERRSGYQLKSIEMPQFPQKD